jgi:hypothetical protein
MNNLKYLHTSHSNCKYTFKSISCLDIWMWLVIIIFIIKLLYYSIDVSTSSFVILSST